MRKVLVAAGDGIGPEVIGATLHVIEGLDLDLELVEEPVGMAGHAQWGVAISDETLTKAKEVDAILFGAVTTPPPSTEGYRSPLLTLRKELELYANVRPARPLVRWMSRTTPPPGGGNASPLDVVIVRENTEGLYVRREHAVEGGVVAERLVTEAGTERLVRFAARLAMERERRTVTCIHKANVLRLSDGLFLDTFRWVMAEEAPDLPVSDMHVDAAAAAMVSDPGALDVLVMPNLYGDILSDLAAALTGGLGVAPSASFGTGPPLFEPVHGSAPDIAGRGLANPIGSILSAAMMLEHLGHPEEVARMVSALVRTVEERVVTPDLGGGATTMGFAEQVRNRL